MVGEQPFEERARLHRRPRWRRPARDPMLAMVSARHVCCMLRPVFHRGAHVASDAGDAVAQRFQSSAASPQRSTSKCMNDSSRQLVDPARVGVGSDPPLAAHARGIAALGVAADVETPDGWSNGASGRARLISIVIGIDEERHVVVDDLDDRMVRMPAVFLEIQVVDAHPRGAWHELLGGLPVGHRSRRRGPPRCARAGPRHRPGRSSGAAGLQHLGTWRRGAARARARRGHPATARLFLRFPEGMASPRRVPVHAHTVGKF